MHYCIFNEGKNINISDLENNYEILQIDYIVFNIIDNNIISFKFHNGIFKSAVKKYIEFSVQSDNFTYILKNFSKNRITFGIFEEKILTLLLSYNKLELKDLNFEEENKLEVYEIIQFKLSSYDKTDKIYDKKKPIIITQENYLGENYDLLILIPMPYTNGYKAYFTQIGTNKTKIQINTIQDDLNENKKQYKDGLKKFIGYDIVKVELIFIFDKDTQIGLIDNNDFSGAKYCIDNKIIFYLFSIEDFRLYSSEDLHIFILNDTFEQFKPKITHKRMYDEPKYDFSFLTLEEVQLINNIINDDILNNYYILSGQSSIGNLNKYDKNSIYIFYNRNNRIYIINKKYYHLEEGELKTISKKYINQNEVYESKKLIRINPAKKSNKYIKKYKK